MDYSMPYASGIEIARRIKQNGVVIPVILTSGYISVDMEKITSEAGVAALIAKPINTYHLARAIQDGSMIPYRIIPIIYYLLCFVACSIEILVINEIQSLRGICISALT